jgi:hypothetical protein
MPEILKFRLFVEQIAETLHGKTEILSLRAVEGCTKHDHVTIEDIRKRLRAESLMKEYTTDKIGNYT